MQNPPLQILQTHLTESHAGLIIQLSYNLEDNTKPKYVEEGKFAQDFDVECQIH